VKAIIWSDDAGAEIRRVFDLAWIPAFSVRLPRGRSGAADGQISADDRQLSWCEGGHRKIERIDDCPAWLWARADRGTVTTFTENARRCSDLPDRGIRIGYVSNFATEGRGAAALR